MLKLIILLAAIVIVLIAIKNKRKEAQWESELKDLRIDVMLDYHPSKFEAIKRKFDDLMNRNGRDESIHILWRQFIIKYWREYSELIINEKITNNHEN